MNPNQPNPYSVSESDFGDTIELKFRLTQQQFHALRHLFLDGHSSFDLTACSTFDQLLFVELIDLGLLLYDEHNPENLFFSDLAHSFKPSILDYTELFSRTSSSLSMHAHDNVLDSIPEGVTLMLRQQPGPYSRPEWVLQPEEGSAIPLPADLHLDFFIRNGVHTLRREGTDFYGRRFRGDVSYLLHVHLWN